jgi:beta-lactamase regulating signal transducer with metallopeptidase domain
MSWTEFHPVVQEALRTTFAVGLLITLVLVVRKPFSRRFGAKAGYLLWALPLVRFVMPPLPGNWSLSGLLGWTPGTPSSATPNEFTAPAIVFNPSPNPAEMIAAEPATAVPERAFEPAATFIPTTTEAVTSGTSLLEAVLVQAPLILTIVWVAGTVLWLGRSIYQQRQFLQLIEDDSQPANEETATETVRIARQLGLKRVPEVRASLLCSGPLVTGLKNPVILLPMWFEDDYTIGERRDAIIHELMHLKRRDLWAFQAARIVAATQWFNPLVHLGLHAFRTDQESACDADVIRRAKLSPAAYGRTLVKAARLARPSDRRIAAASLTLAHPIKERLIMMTNPTPSLRSRLLGGTLAVALGAGAVFATASSVAQELDGGEKSRTETSTFVEENGKMSFKMTVDGETFEFSTDDMPVMPPMPEMPALPALPGMSMDQDGSSFHMSLNTEDFEGFENSEAYAAWESNMEAWGEEMEAWGELVEQQAETWGEDMEPMIEAWAARHSDSIEARADEWAQRVEMLVEAQVERVERDAERASEKAERDAERAERQVERAAEKAERQVERAQKRSERNSAAYSDASSAKMVSGTETRDFGTKSFDKVEVGSGLSVVYTQDPNASVTAKLERGSWDHVDVKVEGRTLKVYRKGKHNSYGNQGPKLTVYASSKSLKSVDAGSGSSFQGIVVAGDLRVDASSGSALTLEGACKTLFLDASSGSSVRMDKLECSRANVDASSGSSISVYASNRVDVDASSGSAVRVSGNPKEVSKDLSSGASVSIN